MGLQVPQFWWLPIWCEAETVAVRAEGDKAQCLQILQDLLVENEGVSWSKVAKEDLSA